MTLSSKQMKVLEAQSASFTSSHSACLAQSIDALRRSRDPRAVVRLLRALSRDARAKQRAAQQDISRWIEDRLRSEPGVAVERVELELGWLRRLSVARSDGATSRSGYDKWRR